MGTFTRSGKFATRHYEAIANAINERARTELLYSDASLGIAAVINALAVLFKNDNPKFDEKRFRAACWRGTHD
jgi:hypothetical protein